MSARVLATSVMVACAACENSRRHAPLSLPQGADCAIEIEAHAIAARIAAARGMTGAPLRVRALDEKEFGAVWKRTGEGYRPPTDVGLLKRIFSVPRQPKLAKDAEGSNAFLGGFYDPETKTLVVRRELGGQELPLDVFDHALAHEIEHAFQDARYGLAIPVKDTRPPERRLPEYAAFEGDAEVTAALYTADDANVRRVAEHAADKQAPGARDFFGAMSSPSRRIVDPFITMSLDFRYVDGTRWASAMVRAGGLRNLDLALEKPPKTTEQLLRPDKYLLGENAIALGELPLTDGWSALESGTIGAAQTAMILDGCLPWWEARDAARDWGGDAYRLSTSGDALSMTWASEWDDEEAAKRFERALRSQASCWSRPLEKGKWSVADLSTLERRGTRVVMVRGLTPTSQYVDSIFAVDRTVPPRTPPLGGARDVGDDGEGELLDEAQTIVSSALGLSLRIPAGHSARAELDRWSLLVQARGPRPRVGGAAFAVFPVTVIAPAEEKLWVTAAARAKELSDDANAINLYGTQAITIAGAPAHQRTYGTPSDQRACA